MKFFGSFLVLFFVAVGLAGCGRDDSATIALAIEDGAGREEVFRGFNHLKGHLSLSGPRWLRSDYPMEIYYWDNELGKYHLGNRQYFSPGIKAEISGKDNRSGRFLVVFDRGWWNREIRLEIQLAENTSGVCRPRFFI